MESCWKIQFFCMCLNVYSWVLMLYGNSASTHLYVCLVSVSVLVCKCLSLERLGLGLGRAGLCPGLGLCLECLSHGLGLSGLNYNTGPSLQIVFAYFIVLFTRKLWKCIHTDRCLYSFRNSNWMLFHFASLCWKSVASRTKYQVSFKLKFP